MVLLAFSTIIPEIVATKPTATIPIVIDVESPGFVIPGDVWKSTYMFALPELFIKS